MTYLWDTHALIWAMEDDPQLSGVARILAAQRSQNAICGISLWEVACLTDKKRIKLSIPLAHWMNKVIERLPVLNITGDIAARCYALGKFHGDPADRIIVATALVHRLTIITKDGKISKHPGVKTIWD
ncbi:MAG TPA: type II toxin-antitoxin system VapC family toxin [Methylomirabilota bacterium]|nr:type II toxin-antitoxin system VapC family toxin [Methylomirabilota bacterium]